MASGKALYSIIVVILGFICFVVGAIAIGLPTWGYFYSLENPNFDKGYFGPWRVCKSLLYNREKCGTDVSKFRPNTAVYIAGVVGSIGVSVLAVFCVLSVLQLAMISSKEQVGFKYTHLVMMKLALALLATLLSIAAAGLFAVQGDDRGFYLTRGEAFYVQPTVKPLTRQETKILLSLIESSNVIINRTTDAPTNQLKNEEWYHISEKFNAVVTSYRTPQQLRLKWENLKKNCRKHNTLLHMHNIKIVCIVINSALFIMSLYDTLFSRRVGGDPTNPIGEAEGTTINNPGFKEGRGISMTDASGKPYSTNGHGSVASMNTTATTLTGQSDASTITRSPLRSSLKKPRMGIQNPGYSGHSPPLNRNGSLKKVRIQTHSTEV